jgi:hypothetical protein
VPARHDGLKSYTLPTLRRSTRAAALFYAKPTGPWVTQPGALAGEPHGAVAFTLIAAFDYLAGIYFPWRRLLLQ